MSEGFFCRMQWKYFNKVAIKIEYTQYTTSMVQEE